MERVGRKEQRLGDLGDVDESISRFALVSVWLTHYLNLIPPILLPSIQAQRAEPETAYISSHSRTTYPS